MLREDLVHVSVDLETLGIQPGCAVLSVGMVAFRVDALKTKPIAELFVGIDPLLSEEAGFHRDIGTVRWWEKQSASARKEAFGGKNSPWQACQLIEKWWKKNAAEYFWGHGSVFDEVILRSVFQTLGGAEPWHYANVRDTRTLFDITGIYPKRNPLMHHKALEDAKQQAIAIQRSHAELKKWLSYGPKV